MNAQLPVRTNAEQALVTAFEGARSRLPGGKQVAKLRQQAIDGFLKLGLPTRRVEDWKYTDLSALMRDAPPLAGPPDQAAIAHVKALDPLPGVNARRIVLLNGAFVPELSDLAGLEAGLKIVPLAHALAEGDKLTERIGALAPTDYDAPFALNTAFLSDGVLIEIAKGTRIERPIHVQHVFSTNAPVAVFTRALLLLGEGAQLTYIESHFGPDRVAYQANSAIELHLDARASLDLIRLQAEGDAALHLSTLLAKAGEGVKLRICALTTGAAVSRYSATLHCTGRDEETRIAAATLLRARQHADTTLVIDHSVPACASRVLFKSVLDQESRGVVQGRVVVHPQAQKTDAKMMLGALLLGEAAEADHKPELEIYADDVQCGHGATAGALDESLLFYLRARGIPRKEAEALLIESFVGEAFDAIEHEPLREALRARANAWLAARG
jgi:Fe-S cluster assembly protein SufD